MIKWHRYLVQFVAIEIDIDKRVGVPTAYLSRDPVKLAGRQVATRHSIVVSWEFWATNRRTTAKSHHGCYPRTYYRRRRIVYRSQHFPAGDPPLERQTRSGKPRRVR